MLTEQRKRYLVDALRRDGRIIAKSVAQSLSLSEDTIRRDLRELASDGLLMRVHGGALPISPAIGDLRSRDNIMPAEKIAIGRYAASLIQPGQIIFIDGGTTARQLARHSDPAMQLTIITHSPTIASDLIHHAADVLVIGGRLFKHSMVNVGAIALQAMKDVRPDIFFMGATGVHPETGLTTGDAEEAAMKRAISEASAETVVMASSEKLGAASPFVIAPIEQADILIVPSALRKADTDAYTKRGIEIHRA